MLFGLQNTDPMSLAIVIGVLAAVGAFASLIPARRATKVDPMVALRYE
jgi:ABC-type lipoprotein release transport system permease subunit